MLTFVTTLKLEVASTRDTLPLTIQALRHAIRSEGKGGPLSTNRDTYRTTRSLMEGGYGVLSEVSLHVGPELLKDPKWEVWLNLGPWLGSGRA